MNFAIGVDLTTILTAAEDVHPRIGWVLEHTQYAAVAQPSPYNLAIPRPAVRSLGKSQSPFREAMYDRIGAARFAKEAKYHFYRAPHFCIGVRNDAALLVVAITDRKREAQLAFFRFVELTALEARVQKMQLGLSHGPLQPEQEAVVEIRRIVATVFVDHQRVAVSAHNSNSRCQSRFDRASRDTSSAAETLPAQTPRPLAPSTHPQPES